MTAKSKSTIDDRLDAEFAPAWKPKPGDKVVGEVVAISEREGGYGRYPIVTIRCADGDEVAVHAFRTVLASRLAEVRPQSGEQLGIKYEGERDGGERRYHSYKVAVDRPERPIDWSTYSEDVPAEPAADVPTDSDGLPGTDEDVPF